MAKAPKRDPYSFMTIEELTGKQREVVLSGVSMPLQGAEWSGQQRRNVRRYPGSSSAGMQVLGLEELPSSFTLRIDEKEMSIEVVPKLLGVALNGLREQITTVEDAVFLFNSIMVDAQEVEVEWGNRVRRGLLARVTETPAHSGLSTLDLEFDWRERSTTNIKFTSHQEPTAAATSIFDKVNELMAAYNEVKEFLNENILGVVDAWIRQANAAAGSLASIVGDIASLPELASSQLRNMLGVIGKFSQMMFDVRHLVDSVAEFDLPELPSFDWDAASASTEETTPISEAKAEQFFSHLTEQTQSMRETAVALWWDIISILDGDDVLAVDVAIEGSSLFEYAETYYNDKSRWSVIAEYNGMDSPRLSGGEIIVIPKI